MMKKDKNITANTMDQGVDSRDVSTSTKNSKFLQKTKNAVGSVLGSAIIGLGAGGEAVAPAVVPAAVETAVAGVTGNLAINTISLGTAATLLSACNPEEDVIAPTITVKKSNFEIKGELEVSIRGNSLYIGNDVAVTWKDNESSSCSVSMTFNGKGISSGYKITEGGTLTIFVTDESGNVSKKENILVSMANEAPEIEVKQGEVNVKGGKEVSKEGKNILLGGEVVATWKDDLTENCEVKFKVNGKEVKSGDKISEEGVLVITVTDEQGKSSSVEIKLIVNNEAPEIEVKQGEVNVKGGKEINKSGKNILLGGEVVATWKDDLTENCEVKFKVNGKEVKSGDKISEEGVLVITVTDEQGKSSSVEIKLIVNNEAPEIEVKQGEVNVKGGKEINKSGKNILLGGEVVATWKDDLTENCEVKFKVNGKEVKSGDKISEEGVLVITVTDEQGKSSSVEIKLINVAVYGLENLKSLNLKVDQEVNLMQGISFADGFNLQRVDISIDGDIKEIRNPESYTPEYPGSCDIVFVLQTSNGDIIEEEVKGLHIEALDYNNPNFDTVNVIDKYQWYEVLSKGKQDFIYDHILTSYINKEWFDTNDIIYILMGEAPLKDEYNIENIGDQNDVRYTSHGSDGYFHIMNITPGADVKACCGEWSYLEKYILKNPNSNLLISCALDCLGGDDLQSLKDDPNYYSLKNILKSKNCIFSISGGNVKTITKILNELESEQPYGQYMSASVNSGLNNKITIVGCNPSEGGLLKDNIFGQNMDSRRPVGFGKNRKNIVIPFIPLISINNFEYTNTNSSYPAGTESSSLGNFLSIIMSNNPGLTLEGAMTVMLDKYLYEDTFKYVNDKGEVVNGETRFLFDTKKFLEEEVLIKSKINNIQFNGDIVELPFHNGICYKGLQGVQFELNGELYNVTNENMGKLNSLLKSGADIKYYWNRKMWRKYGGKSKVTFDVVLLSKNGEEIPDISLKNITKTVN